MVRGNRHAMIGYGQSQLRIRSTSVQSGACDKNRPRLRGTAVMNMNGAARPAQRMMTA
jgi:hypothetical protein